jgi:hypothetical protein
MSQVDPLKPSAAVLVANYNDSSISDRTQVGVLPMKTRVQVTSSKSEGSVADIEGSLEIQNGAKIAAKLGINITYSNNARRT